MPVNDTHTLNFRYQGLVPKEGQTVSRAVPARRDCPFDEKGNLTCSAENVPEQDMIAWMGQGAIGDRSHEHLLASDRGIAIFRQLLEENMARAERGEE